MNTQIPFEEKHVLLDIEGTTTSISFVKDVLFPFARKHLEKYIKQNWENEEIQTIVTLLKEQCAEDLTNNLEGVIPIEEGEKQINSIINNFYWQMDHDRKTNVLKMLQGHIWRSGYFSGEMEGHVYEDVKPALQFWKQNEKLIYIYSSGSVEAQKLLFGNSVCGNMLGLFAGFFDTNVGRKSESYSYMKIAQIIGCTTSDILFLTDVVKEANAALQAGCRVIITERPGNSPLSNEDRQKYKCIHSFHELLPVSKME